MRTHAHTRAYPEHVKLRVFREQVIRKLPFQSGSTELRSVTSRTADNAKLDAVAAHRWQLTMSAKQHCHALPHQTPELCQVVWWWPSKHLQQIAMGRYASLCRLAICWRRLELSVKLTIQLHNIQKSIHLCVSTS